MSFRSLMIDLQANQEMVMEVYEDQRGSPKSAMASLPNPGAPGAGPNNRGRVYVYGGLSDKPKFIIEADETGAALGAMFRRFRKRADCEAELARVAAQPGGFAAATEKEQHLATFKSHTVLCCELVDWVVAEKIPGTFSFDGYFTNAPICNWFARHERGYVGDLKFNRKVWFRGIEMRADEMAAQIPFEARKKVTIGSRTQWYFTKKIWLPDYTHAVRVVILWNHWNSKEAAKILITNQTHWEVTRVLRGYGQRWTGTETLHRDGKQHLGLGDCQLRSGEGQTRHFYLVLLVHSLLVSQLRQGRARAWATETLMTIGEACRSVLRETLGKTVSWAIERATLDGWQPNRIKAHLNLV